jgi:hypothetical protein
MTAGTSPLDSACSLWRSSLTDREYFISKLPSQKAVAQLRMLDDALVVYRLTKRPGPSVRLPEDIHRRVSIACAFGADALHLTSLNGFWERRYLGIEDFRRGDAREDTVPV